MSAETDLARAWVTRWEATAAITGAVPGGITTDEVSQGQALPDDAVLPMPYAVLKIELERKKYAHRHWNEWHKVTVELFAEDSKLDVGAIVSAINTAFACPAARLSFSGINSGRVHAHTEVAEDKEEPTGEKRRGRHVRLARMVYSVHTVTTGY